MPPTPCAQPSVVHAPFRVRLGESTHRIFGGRFFSVSRPSLRDQRPAHHSNVRIPLRSSMGRGQPGEVRNHGTQDDSATGSHKLVSPAVPASLTTKQRATLLPPETSWLHSP